jgi:hypothetical protein
MSTIDDIIRLAQLDDDKPTIVLAAGEMTRILDEVQDALLADTAYPVFQRGGTLVHLQRIPEAAIKDGIHRAAGALVISTASTRWLQSRMAACARFVKYVARDGREVAKDPPFEYATLLAEIGDWRFPALHAVIETPTLRPDGTVLDQPGYDKATGLYFAPNCAAFSPVPKEPTREDAMLALEALTDVVSEFPFVDQAAKAVALAAILTAVVRRSLRTAPLFVFDAPVMESGKTLLAEVVGLIATGRSLPAMSYSGDEAEERKRITAALLAGDPIVLIDNISSALKGDALCAVLTQETWRDRVLGVSRVVVLPTCTTWLATGNNISVAGDLTTRVLSCRIDPQCEAPGERTFERPDLRAFVRQHRGSLVCAALTVLRAYVCAGRPAQDIKPFGRFEQWSDLVRSALIWLDCDDPCATRERLMLDDNVRAGLAEILVAWRKMFGTSPVTTAQVIKSASNNAECGDTQMKDALEGILFRGELKAKALGYWLAKHADRVVDGMALRRVERSRGKAIWQLWG